MSFRWPWVSRSRCDAAMQAANTLAELAAKREIASAQEVTIWRNRAESAATHVDILQGHSKESGEQYNALLDRMHDASVRADDAVHAERTRYSDLLARYHGLKLMGALSPEPERIVTERTYDPVLTAVNNACAGKDIKVRSAMLRQVAIDRDNKVSDTEIILRIQRGTRPADEVSATPGETRHAS